MEEIICQFEGWVRVTVYKIKKNNYVVYDILTTYIDSEEKAMKLLNKLVSYQSCIFLIHKDKIKAPEVPFETIFKENSSDLCLVQHKNCLFIRNFDDFNLAAVSNETCLVIYPQGLEKFQGTSRNSYEYYYYLTPIIGLIVLIYLIENGLAHRGKGNSWKYQSTQ